MRMRSRYLVPVVVLALASSVDAAPLVARNVKRVRVHVNRRARRGLGVQSIPHGWRLALRDRGSGDAQAIDVTPGTPARTVDMPVAGGVLFFDLDRFAAGHTYHVRVHRAGMGARVARGYVYLLPPPRRPTAAPQRLDFTDGDEPADAAGDDEPLVARSDAPR
jgi:hypothetical protein